MGWIRKPAPKPGTLVALETVAWIPIMLGPIAVVYGPAIPIPYLTGAQQVDAYLFLWLLFTPVSWYLGVKAIFGLLLRTGVTRVYRQRAVSIPEPRAREGILYILLGALAVASQYAFFGLKPYLFLVSSQNTVYQSLTITSITLAVILGGAGLVAYGFRLLITQHAGRNCKSVARLLGSGWPGRAIMAGVVYLVFSLFSVGTFGIGGVPPGLAVPSATLFASGIPLFAPAVTVYLTSGFGLVLVPEHLLVAGITSYLFGLNMKAVFLMNSSRRVTGFVMAGGLPAVALACPTCTLASFYFVIEVLSANAVLGLGVLASPYFDGFLVIVSWVGLGLSALYLSRKLYRE